MHSAEIDTQRLKYLVEIGVVRFKIDIGDATRKRSRMELRHDRRADIAMSLAMQSAMCAVDSAAAQTRGHRGSYAAQACVTAIDSIRQSAGWASGAVAGSAVAELEHTVRRAIPTLDVLRSVCLERTVT